MFLILKNNGLFYEAVDNDAMIIHYLFGYKISKGNKIGFPVASKNKVLNILDNKKINYKINDVDKKIIEKDFKNLNNYEKVLEKAFKLMVREKQLKRLQRNLEKLDSEKLEKLLNMIGDYVNEK